MLKKIYSALMLVLGGIFGGVFYYIMKIVIDPDYEAGQKVLRDNGDYSMFILSVFVFAFTFYFLAPVVSKKGAKVTLNIGRDLEGVSSRSVLAGTVGTITGLILALLISMTYRSVLSSGWYAIVTMVLYILCGFLGFAVEIGLSKDKSPGSVLEGIVSSRMSRKADSVPKIVDTSVIIDGRIADIMDTGFLEGPVAVPDFVLVELRHIADSSDSLKRAKGRRGLDVLDRIQKDFGVEIYNTSKITVLDEIPEVDVKLIKLTQNLGGRLLTTDYNLNKVAGINGIKVMNINDLANAIKQAVIPGESLEVEIVKQGKEPAQGIAYLDDGTMVVVEDGRKQIGSKVKITVTSVIQTSAGKMIFGRVSMRQTAS